MAVTIKQTEATPDDYPVPDGLSSAADALDSDMIWQRLESYIVHRWTARDVTWIVEGPGDWDPPLTPATIATTELWQDDDGWQAVTLSASALGGYVLPGCGPYRFTGTVGDGEVPEIVDEAFRRLAEYMAADSGTAGAQSESTDIPGVLRKEISRAPSWMARAMQNSGAADLLRAYRRA